MISEVFSHSNTRGRSKELQGISIGKPLDNLGNSGSLLSNSNVDAVHFLLGVSSIIESLLVDNSIDGNSSFSSLSVSNDQFTLTTTNWHKGVDGLDTSLHRLADRLSWDNARSFDTNSESVLGSKGALAVNGVSKSINNTSKNFHPNWDVHNSSSSLHNISFLDQFIATEYDNTNVVGFQVESHAPQSRAEFHHFLGLDVLETIDTSNTVSNRQDSASFFKIDCWGSSKNSFLQNGRNFS